MSAVTPSPAAAATDDAHEADLVSVIEAATASLTRLASARAASAAAATASAAQAKAPVLRIVVEHVFVTAPPPPAPAEPVVGGCPFASSAPPPDGYGTVDGGTSDWWTELMWPLMVLLMVLWIART